MESIVLRTSEYSVSLQTPLSLTLMLHTLYTYKEIKVRNFLRKKYKFFFSKKSNFNVQQLQKT